MQKRKRNMIFGVIAAAVALVSFIGCDVSSGSGTMEVSITDAPLMADNVDHVFITVEGIQYHTTEDGWMTMTDYEEAEAFDLLALTRGESRLLGELVLPAGEYTQIRFLLTGVDEGSKWNGDPEKSGSWIVIDGENKPLFVPSGSQSGYKATAGSPFVVPVNGSVAVTADFDLRQAVVKRGANDSYILKPVLRLVVNDEAGTIQGNVTGTETEEDYNYVIYAFEAPYDSGDNDPADEDAVTSSSIDELTDEPDYVLAYLAEGSYHLVVAQYDSTAGEYLGRTDIDGTVEVTSGEAEPFDIHLD